MSTSIIIDWFPTATVDHRTGERHFCSYGYIGYCEEKDRQAWAGRATMALGTSRYFLQGQFHDWLSEMNPNYHRDVKIEKQWVEGVQKGCYSEDRCAFVLTFRRPAMAAIFKLRWHNAE